MVVDNEDFLKAFGKVLQQRRKAQNLSYRKMAQLCNIDHSDISKIEKGEVNIRLLTLVELAKGLNIAPQNLLDFEFEFKD
ncbi:transcriptional regulator [Arachidicoccus ginsenosidimutans]|nr:transcriptional regulator [Arachidicoccus sp. BS20]